jgi:DNA-binding transcriptional LysR family regulator
MQFQQLRYLVAVHENDLNMTTAAQRLHIVGTAQSWCRRDMRCSAPAS